MSVLTSEQMQQRAAEALKQDTVLKSTPDFDVLALPAGFMEHLVLFLWKEGRDFAPGQLPRDYLFPVQLDGRQGYLWGKEAALAFNA